MPFKTFGAGDVLTATDVQSYLMSQAVIVCTSGGRPSTPVEGMTIYETDTDTIRTYDGSAWRPVVRIGQWVSYTPTVVPASGSFAIGNGTVAGRYTVLGNTIAFKNKFIMGSTTTYGTGASYAFGLPVNRDTSVDDVFSALLIDSSASTLGYRSATAFAFNASDYSIILHEGSSGQFVGPTSPWAWATGDIIRVAGTYQVA